MSGLLDLEPLIAARLRAHLDASVTLASALDIESLHNQTARVPAVFLIYAGAQVAESRPDGLAVRLRQTWLTVVAVRNARLAASGEDARAAAGPIADAVLAALSGWRPEGVSAPFALADCPEPGLLPGYFSLPLAFSTELVRRFA